MAKSPPPRKRFGQNFLQDQASIHQIIQALNPQPDQHIVEIGPGRGALTTPLIAQSGQLSIIELDRDLAAKIPAMIADHPQAQLIQADALRVDFQQLSQGSRDLRILGNLPYNISTPLLFHLLNFAPHIQDMHLMLQKEVVDRLAASHGGKDYGRLSVITQYHCEVVPLFDVPPNSFYPQPKVDSAVVRLIPYSQPPYPAVKFEVLQQLVTQAFSQRRKTLRNSLKGLCTDAQLAELGYNPQARAEQLSVADFVNLANILAST